MKKIAAILALLASFVSGFAQPKINQVSFPDTVDLFGLYEISFTMNAYNHPYDPEIIHAYAVFDGPDGQRCTVDAFYYEGYDFSLDNNKYEKADPRRNDKGWRIRFTPTAVGDWKFSLHAIDKKGATHLTAFKSKRFAFSCHEVAEAQGFIAKANTRFLKREVVTDGQRKDHSFFPVGPNVAWYDAADYGRYNKPFGIYDYQFYLDKLSGNANYMRIWINRYQFLAIYGPENTELVNGKPRMYFDSSLNQKDAAELDFIVEYAKKHDVSIMPCIFNFRNFMHKTAIKPATQEKPGMPSDWINNPYHTVLGLKTNYEFFTDSEAKRISKNLLRYIVARWGYATNILCWELWNEVSNMANGEAISEQTQRDIAQWHQEMADFLRSIDPYQHLISTSMGGSDKARVLYSTLFDDLDFVQHHNYQNIQKAISREQFPTVLLRYSEIAFAAYHDKPVFMGEFGFGQDNPARKYADKDPYGIDLHNSLWSSAFSCSMGPASFWWWNFLRNNNLFFRFKPVFTFLSQLPIPSDSFTPKTTGELQNTSMVCPNDIETFYMINAAQDTLYGWCQDVAFRYQSLRLLTDPVGNNNHFIDNKVNDPKGYVYTLSPNKKPQASSRSNTISIPVGKQPSGTKYAIRWFDAETGLEITSEATTASVRGNWFTRKTLSFEFPTSIRDPKTRTINNTFGDAVFMIVKIQ